MSGGWGGGGGGGAPTTVAQDIGADFNSAFDSTWHDITGLTGIALAAGTWIGMVDLEIAAGTDLGPVFRVFDGTTTYGQSAMVRKYVAPISGHHEFNTAPMVLPTGATVSIQVYTDSALTVCKYPIRGGIASSVASHVTFLKVA